MVSTLTSFGAIFIATVSFVMGNGVLNTQLSLRMTMAGFPPLTTGLVMTCYFSGVFSGYFLCPRLISRVGHIRCFAAFAAITTATIILHSMYVDPLFWAILRYLTGITIFGIFMIIESWLNECADSGTRGRVFSIYMTITYMGICIGQQLLNVGDVDGQNLFSIAALLISLSLVPVSITRAVHPKLPNTSRYTLKALFLKAPIGMLGCIVAGLSNSAFFAIAPVFGLQIGLTIFQLSWLMSATLFGGFAIQWVIGTLSDRFDRTVLLLIVAVCMAGGSILIIVNSGTSISGLLFEMIAFGSLMFAIYPLAVARAHDVFETTDAVAVSSALILCYSMGAIFGPVLASAAMTVFKTPFGLFGYWSLVSMIFAVVVIYLKYRQRVEIIPVEEQAEFTPIQNTSSVAMGLDPRTDLEYENSRPAPTRV
jgi:MFS family permease